MLIAPKEDDDSKHVVVYFADVDKFGKEQLTDIVKNLAKDSERNNVSLRHAIVILKFDCKYVSTINSKGFKLIVGLFNRIRRFLTTTSRLLTRMIWS